MNGNRLIRILFLSLMSCVCTPVQSQSIAPFRKGDRVAFVGNSITDGGHYHSYIWLYYMTHFPRMRLWMANCGVGGDTAKDILARFDDDVLAKEPTVVTFTFGMNDTGYYEYNGNDSADFARRKYEETRQRFALCEEKLKSLKDIRTVMIGTSPYDQTSTFNDEVFARKNDNMQRVVSLQKEAAERNGWEFLDFNAPMVAMNRKQQQTDPAFTLIGSDRIHPDNDGHMAMAYLFLQAQGMVGRKVADMEVDALKGKATKSGNCRISKVKPTYDGLQFDCLAASLPFPLDTVAQSHEGHPVVHRRPERRAPDRQGPQRHLPAEHRRHRHRHALGCHAVTRHQPLTLSPHTAVPAGTGCDGSERDALGGGTKISRMGLGQLRLHDAGRLSQRRQRTGCTEVPRAVPRQRLAGKQARHIRPDGAPRGARRLSEGDGTARGTHLRPQPPA